MPSYSGVILSKNLQRVSKNNAPNEQKTSPLKLITGEGMFPAHNGVQWRKLGRVLD